MRPFASYHDYERILATEILLPFLQRQRMDLNGMRVLDAGCGAGGFLNGLASRCRIEGLGLDYDGEMLAQCRPASGVRLEQVDFLAWESAERFDLILLRDVLEHCDRAPQMLAHAARFLASGGRIYVTYSPYWSPFGAHQHNGSGVFSNLPFLHVLPEAWFLRLLRVRDNIYKHERQLREDLNQIRRARLTTGQVTASCRQLGLRIRHRRRYVVRPDYRYKFGLPTVPLPSLLPLHSCWDPFCTSVELLLEREAGTAEN